MSFALDADPRYGRFGLRTECPRCGAHLPVNGPASEVDCAGCGHRVDVPEEVLRSMLEAFEDGWPDAAHADSVTVRDLTWRWTSDPVEGPACPACEARLDDSVADELLACGSCGAQVPSAPPPKDLRRVRGFARVIGGELDQRRDGGAIAPVVLACPACGAGLSITSEHQRITPCEHCGSQVHLPDAVWRQLHPPRTVQPWTVRFQGESRPAAKARHEAEAREKAERKAAEKRERAAKQEAIDRERGRVEAERRREKEQRERAEAEVRRVEREAVERRRQLMILPLNLLSGLGTLLALAFMLAATIAFVAGHDHTLRRYGSGTMGARVVTDSLVVGAAVFTIAVWAFGVVAAALRGRKPVGGVLFWSSFMAGLSILPVVGPFIGLFWAWQHATGAEPTPDTDKLPLGTGWPLAPLYVFGPLYAHLCYAAAGDMTLGEFVRFLFD
jgi:DNA-directed RNA polymerase subunit RPC12/RpoP